MLQNMFLPFFEDSVFDIRSTGSNSHDIRKVCEELGPAEYLCGTDLSRINQHLGRTLSLPRSFRLTGRLDIRAVSNSAGFESLLLSMRIDAPESTTNSLSSGLFLDFLR